jgi:hypothetical protein
LDGFYSIKNAGSALSYYHRKDGHVVALWKRSLAALSFDGGITFSKPVKVPTLTMAGGKNWGQRTDDGRYAMVYNPIELDEYRYPLSLIHGDDGVLFDDMLLVQGEVPPRRFFGRWKDFGPCYVRGIVEGNGNPPGNDMWLTYSMNKEDIWVSRVPVPVTSTIQGDFIDDFDNMKEGGAIMNWNTYSPIWAPVDLVKMKDGNVVLGLKDKDPYDYARAIRVFEESQSVEIAFSVQMVQACAEPFEIDITDRYGNRPVRLAWHATGKLVVYDGNTPVSVGIFKEKEWVRLRLKIDANPYGRFSLWINDKSAASELKLAEAVKSVERISFRTGPYRDLPNRKTPNEEPEPPLPGADEPAQEGIYYLDKVSVKRMP